MDRTERHIFFLGIGGIGMSALARFYRHEGYQVCGYDRTCSPLTMELEREGIRVVYSDTPDLLPALTQGQPVEQVVWTPAVPRESAWYRYFEQACIPIQKRAEALGRITRPKHPLCVAGTHGKTTTSTILAHLLYNSHVGASAFLGGISENYHTNLLLDKRSEYVVVEADEFDRSFHQLSPYMTVVTSVDPDHLDIYGTAESYRESFEHYCGLVQDTILLKSGLQDRLHLPADKRVLTYSAEDTRADYHATDIRVEDGTIRFTFCGPDFAVNNLQLGVPVWINIENSIAAMAIARLCGVTDDELRAGLATYAGVHRRFNIHLNTPDVAYIDDYAHHPQEIAASIQSVRRLYPDRQLLGIFQPHLYTRTRDFADGFAEVLSGLDEIILLPIYPAREEPIAGVDSQMLLEKITNARKRLLAKDELVKNIVSFAEQLRPVVVLTIGAGDIDRLVGEIGKMLKNGTEKIHG